MSQKSVFFFNGQTVTHHNASVVNEFPIQLIVNGREIATLIGSPHELRFLVAGFLRLQGFVSSLDDFELFSVCDEFGTANVRLKKELPEQLKPVLTSGCGTGITFTLPEATKTAEINRINIHFYRPQDIFGLMDELSQRADNYKSHGGIHSAAVGRNGKLMLYAEDLGRHNTFDRIAGEALFKGIHLSDTELVTSGRVSTEMVAKASLLGIRLIASRTSPTDMAVRLCEQAGICLVGYVRGGKFTVYAHPEMIDPPSQSEKIGGVTGVILAGGSSRRMGTNKALLEIDGVPIIEGVYCKLSSLFHEVLIITNTPEIYSFLPCRKAADLYTGIGSIAGLHAGIVQSSYDNVFVTACDMPALDTDLIRRLHRFHKTSHDATIPFSQGGQEPLHAFYSRSSLEVFKQAIDDGERKILDCIQKLNTRFIHWDEIKELAGAEKSFLNVNTPEEYSSFSHN